MSQVLFKSPVDADEIVKNLVTEDDEPVDNISSEREQRLLTSTLYASWKPPADEENSDEPRPFLAAANVGVFFSVNEPPAVPDVFISLDVRGPADAFAKRGRSYFVWEFGKLPDVVVEIVSNKEGGKLERKLKLYARKGIRYYVVHDPEGFISDDKLRVYEPGLANRYYLRNDFQLPNVGLSLTLWRGEFEGLEDEWLRWCDANGEMLPLPGEIIQSERERANQEHERAERLAAKLRELGIEPDKI